MEHNRKKNKQPRQGDVNINKLENQLGQRVLATLSNKKTPNVGGQIYSRVKYGLGRGNLLSNYQGTSMVLEKTEVFFPVTSSGVSGAFTAAGIIFHPMSTYLSWLTNMANSFTTYELLRVEFTYVPSVPTTTAGAFSFAFSEDLRDDTPSTMAQILNTEQSLYAPVYAGGAGGTYLQQFGAPANDVISFELPRHVIADAKGTPKRFRVTKDATLVTTVAASDAGAYSGEAYTPGKLLVATQGITAQSALVGQVFVRYRIRLSGSIAIANQQ